jgi:NADPH2:quinone reductase
MTNSSLVGVFAGGYSRAELEAIHAGLADLVADGHLRTAVTAAIPFDDLATAAQSMADRGVIGKLVLVR